MLSYEEIIICNTYFTVAFINSDYVTDYPNEESEIGISNLYFT